MLIYVYACIYARDIQISKEQKKLGDRAMWRILEKSDFRPTDVDTKKFRAEKFKQRWFAYYVIQDLPSNARLFPVCSRIAKPLLNM